MSHMKFPSTLVAGRLVRRYKRFLADAELDDGSIITAHCANPGAMTGFKTPGIRMWMSTNNNPKRKLKYSWELAETGPDKAPQLVGINTSYPNTIVREAIENNRIAELTGYEKIRAEVAYGKGSRVDFLLEGTGRPDCYLEVKNVHLMRRPGLAEFPDSVTARGTKHLRELAGMAAHGHRAVMLYLVQRGDARKFAIAADIDPEYAKNFKTALDAGVEAYAYDCQISLSDVTLDKAIPVYNE